MSLIPTLPRIRVEFWMKPIPLRQFDYQAVYDDYEGPDGDGVGGGPIGEGRTEADAVVDLIFNHYRGIDCYVRDLPKVVACTRCRIPDIRVTALVNLARCRDPMCPLTPATK